MKLLFVHDFFHVKHHELVYASQQFSTSLWGRYLRYFDSITVVSRLANVDTVDISNLVQSSRLNVEFEGFPSLSSIGAQLTKRKTSRERISSLVSLADAVVARPTTQLGLLAAQEAHRANKPWLAEVTGCSFNGLWNHGSWKGKAYAPIMALRMKRAVARAPFVTYVSREFLQHRYPNRTGRQVACSDVEIETPSEVVLQQRLRRIDEQPRPVKLGLIGSLKTRYKGLQTVFAALARIRNQLPPVEFHVLGPGNTAPWREEARSCGVADMVYFDDLRAPGVEVFAWLDDIDLYLQPSFTEGLPRATVEAISRGCPVIGSTCGGIPELVDDDCLIKPGDDAHLAQLIVQAVTDADWQKRQAQTNWNTAHEYSSDILNARRDEMLAALADAARAKTAGAVV